MEEIVRVLLIWEEVPERLRFYLIEDPTPEQTKMLELANGMLINSDDENEGMAYLNVALSSPEYSNGESHAGIWMNNEVETPVQGPIARMYHSGFMM